MGLGKKWDLTMDVPEMLCMACKERKQDPGISSNYAM